MSLLRTCFVPLLFAASSLWTTAALGQDPQLKDTFQQAKVLWGNQGDRDGATARFEQVQSALEGKELKSEWAQILAETYNWLAVLDNGSAARKSRVNAHLEALLNLNPDFELDSAITNGRLLAAFDGLRNAKLVKVALTLEPQGGELKVDGKLRSSALKFLAPGSHRITYQKPGFQTVESQVELALKEPKALEFKLQRTSSTVTIHTSPAGAEVLLDGKAQGQTLASGGELSVPFVLGDLGSGSHVLEVRAPCFKSRRIELDPSFTAPFQDHTLEPLRLEPSRGRLTVQSDAPGGELFLDGKSQGKVPVQDLQICAGTYDLTVRYPAGGFSTRIDVREDQGQSVIAKPMARLVYVGFEGEEDFAGKDRLLKALETLGPRLTTLAFTAIKGESPQAAMARLKTSGEAELVLWVKPGAGRPVQDVELILATFQGEEARAQVKPLEQDPLQGWVERLNHLPPFSRPWIGATLLDVPGEAGPWVLEVQEGAQSAGLKANLPITQVNGQAVATVAEFRTALEQAKGETVTAMQGSESLRLPLTRAGVEIPVNAPDLCYPALLAELRLRASEAKGDELGWLRLNQALAFMHFRRHDRALEILRDTRILATRGVSQGTLDYYTGLCLQRLGQAYVPEAIQAFSQALKYPNATLFGPEGPLVAPLARQAMDDLRP